ncbi:hypothetical protein SAMN05216257_10624 [Meinhardsimonia xiamenensis]|jgi:hypothetical protein|uniref:Lipoprotein n=1 Tax=Meinhardsimonia xiamenensis TaxID=990712 RepID=A0A1G9FZ94_9RHOB|nr:hypothetical protein [Meinhardsimonia xiamenensis]PRX32752.1 hypothetical protein LV81_02514 [Meinhardsimonia xiamenensis]SDK93473.1 hypothetical protein SAMN05216257_10624 [Meinhardsimonia xiamenensis]
MGRRRAITLGVALFAGLALSLGGCVQGLGRLNPLNWFGQAEEVTVDAVEAETVRDPRPLVERVVALEIARRPGGAIVTARGLPPTQGWWAAELVPLGDELPVAGTLAYEFRIAPPPVAKRVGPPRSREVVVARFVSDEKLEGVRAIQVRGRTNALVARR